MSSPALPFLDAFASLLAEATPALLAISGPSAEARPAPGRWSAKEELGHLADSAINNHMRLIRVQIETRPELPGYEQNEWVRRNGYQQREWSEVVELWRRLNHHLLAAARQVSPADWERTAIFSTTWQPLQGEATNEVTLRFLIEDYIEHMRHHLNHLRRIAGESH